ncbi:MOSC domain-containing protein [Actinoplanes subtropicus]|uniref:MOSC domain-containing protein n=1 Tax=Actinoplanes subtropicus TaxID=543632 RepID=UPI0004C2CBED|nr:MOSC domain-containing protein [Actinoplanes subtropicus]
MEAVQGTVVAVSCNDTYSFTKPVRDEIVLIAGVGVKGDVHAGVHVKHRGRVRADPTQPNFRQVHLIQQELFAEVGAKGYAVAAGNLGENVTTSGIDLLGLPVGTILRFGPPAAIGTAGVAGRGDGEVLGEREGGPLRAVLEVAARAELDRETAASAVAIAAAGDGGDDLRPAVVLAGLRNPCGQINGFREGLLKEVLGRDADGTVVRKAGVMGVVLRGGPIRAGDVVTAELPPPPHAQLERV